jgi:hypothetical protein
VHLISSFRRFTPLNERMLTRFYGRQPNTAKT